MSKRKDKAKSAGAHEAIKAAAEQAIEFDIAATRQFMIAMSEHDQSGKTAKEARESATMALLVSCQFTYRQNADKSIPRDTIVKGYGLEFDALRMELAANGSPFVETVTTDNGVTYKWRGYANNVKSVLKGICQFTDHDDFTLPEASAEDVSYRDMRTAVEANRADDADEDAIALREARDILRELSKEYVSEVCKTGDTLIINDAADFIGELHAAFKADLTAQAELDAAAKATAEAEAQDEQIDALETEQSASA